MSRFASTATDDPHPHRIRPDPRSRAIHRAPEGPIPLAAPSTRPPARRRLRPWLGVGAVTGLIVASMTLLPGVASAATTLGASAAERGGRYFGTAVAATS